MGSFGTIIPVLGLNLGFPGSRTRLGDDVIAGRPVFATSTLNIGFGQPVVIDTGTDTYRSVADFIAASGTFSAAIFAGVAVREVKTNVPFPAPAVGGAILNTASYGVGDIADVLERGSIAVVCNVGTPVSQGTVYVRVSANGGNTIIGGFEATSDSTHTVALTGVVWRTSQIDGNNVAEITLLNRVAA